MFPLLILGQDRSTPLHEASLSGQIGVVRLLLDRGAYIYAQDMVSELGSHRFITFGVNICVCFYAYGCTCNFMCFY